MQTFRDFFTERIRNQAYSPNQIHILSQHLKNEEHVKIVVQVAKHVQRFDFCIRLVFVFVKLRVISLPKAM
jgi:hypothetical protein